MGSQEYIASVETCGGENIQNAILEDTKKYVLALPSHR
jgi:hypothetical protein